MSDKNASGGFGISGGGGVTVWQVAYSDSAASMAWIDVMHVEGRE